MPECESWSVGGKGTSTGLCVTSMYDVTLFRKMTSGIDQYVGL